MTEWDSQRAGRDGLFAGVRLAVDLVLSWLEAKAPMQVRPVRMPVVLRAVTMMSEPGYCAYPCHQCPVVSIAPSPKGSFVAMLDLEGGLTLFDTRGNNFTPIGDRFPSLDVVLGWGENEAVAKSL